VRDPRRSPAWWRHSGAPQRLQTALIWINSGAVVFGDPFTSCPLRPDRQLTASPRPRIRHCPVCGIAMQASKSREDLADFDTFQCLSCQTVIRESKPQPAKGNLKARQAPPESGKLPIKNNH
jgi:rubredoxin